MANRYNREEQTSYGLGRRTDRSNYQGLGQKPNGGRRSGRHNGNKRKRSITPNPPSELWRCPYCVRPVKKANFEDHMHVFHPDKVEHDEGSTEVDESRTLRRKGKAKPPRSPNVPIGMARCSICEALVPKSRLDEHMETKHTETEEIPLERCSECNARVRADRMERHLKKVHKK